jgi:hypothetical protein
MGRLGRGSRSWFANCVGHLRKSCAKVCVLWKLVICAANEAGSSDWGSFVPAYSTLDQIRGICAALAGTTGVRETHPVGYGGNRSSAGPKREAARCLLPHSSTIGRGADHLRGGHRGELLSAAKPSRSGRGDRRERERRNFSDSFSAFARSLRSETDSPQIPGS